MVNIFALAELMFCLFVGEWISKFTKAYVPSVFVTAMMFLIGYWTIFPKNIVQIASFDPIFMTIVMSAIIVHMGTLMDLRTLINQWKVVVIALCGVLGTIILALGIGLLLFRWKVVIASVPPLTGGIVAAFLMANGLRAQHIMDLIAFPTSMFVVHSIIGYPLTAFLLKKEDRRLIGIFRSNQNVRSHSKIEQKDTLKPFIPEKYRTAAFNIFLVLLIGLISFEISNLIHNVINPYVIGLILGVIAHQAHLLESNVLEKSGVFNWFLYAELIYIFSDLNVVKPSNLPKMLVPIITMIALGIFGMFVVSFLLAKPMGLSKSMAFACALTALFGFPADYIVTREAAHNVASNVDEYQYIMDHTMPKMVVGGFATVSVASVFIASIFLKLL
ncbi:hypothetical protein WR164_15170 [Philodulcilactobacillus myokoensis]|uniref:Uncharacterized protein n=1 Tax=Philodulcilactobacillus myokoensis TaxID=2929573 RepID=A0A9W6B2U4_9LACO|nr:hypothetical protein [Philodulcilactobacillus myokoensis]GLB47538.1 hypothetical protein WR164_15170 [Philodulcilactobacillus myokoensis]